MTISAARLAANQQNAQRSTGPKTEAGKNRSRLNAIKHAMAGAGDVVALDENLALIDHRTAAFCRELGATGEIGTLLARRAAVLSVRLDLAAERDLKATAANVRAARCQFDIDREDFITDLVAQLDGTEAPHAALAELAGMPEGIAILIDLWDSIRAAVVARDLTSASQAAEWLDRTPESFRSFDELIDQIDAERARLTDLAASPAIQRVTLAVNRARDEAGVLGSLDVSAEATLAHRYELAAERGMYRAIRGVADLRREQGLEPMGPPAQTRKSTPATPTAPPAPSTPPTPSRAESSPQPAPAPAPTPAPAPAPTAPLGSFRAAGGDPGYSDLNSAAGRVEPTRVRPEPLSRSAQRGGTSPEPR